MSCVPYRWGRGEGGRGEVRSGLLRRHGSEGAQFVCRLADMCVEGEVPHPVRAPTSFS